ncbi:MAG: AMP-binding protein [Bacilli bacterium]
MDRSSKRYLKKLIRTSLDRLKSSDYSFSAIYDVIFSFSDETYFETSNNGIIEKITYGQVHEKIERAKSAIAHRLEGIPAHSFVALKLDNCENWVIAFWAILKSGYRPFLVNTRMSDSFNDQLLKALDIKAVISDAPFLNYLFVDVKELAYAGLSDIDCQWADEIALSTSGTTGKPKVCVYDGRAISMQILNSEYALKENWTLASFDKKEFKHLAFLPFYHIFGLTALLLWFSFFGRTFVFLKDISPTTIANTCQRHNITIFFSIPMVWNLTAQSLIKEVEKQDKKTIDKFYRGLKISNDLQSAFPKIGKRFAIRAFRSVREKMFGNGLKFAISGGGYIPQKTLYIMNGLGYSLYNGYGTTEIGITSVELRYSSKCRNLGSIGKSFPSVQYRISDGELLVKGSSLHKGLYIDNKYILRDHDEFYHTGDVASIDNRGYYYIKGRKDDLFIDDSGELISPDYVESYFSSPYLSSLCVLGVVENGKEELTLVFEPKIGINPYQEAKLYEHIKKANQNIPDFMKIKSFRKSLKELPQVIKGTIQRQVLKRDIEISPSDYPSINIASLKEIGDEQITDIERSLTDEICLIFASCFNLSPREVKADSDFLYDLHGTSMQYFEIVHTIADKYNIEFTFEKNDIVTTPRQFARLVMRKS